MCVDHQLLLRDYDELDRNFILEHLRGCHYRTLATFLGKSRQTFWEYITVGRLKTIEPGSFIVRPDSMLWAIDLVRNWVCVDRKLMALTEYKKYEAFLKLVRDEKFGETREYLNGSLAIHKSQISLIAERCRKIRLANSNNNGMTTKKYLRKGEMSPPMAAKKLRCLEKEIRHWMKTGDLKYSRRGEGNIKWHIIRQNDFWLFVKLVADGTKKDASTEFIDQCRRAYKDYQISIPNVIKMVMKKS